MRKIKKANAKKKKLHLQKAMHSKRVHKKKNEFKLPYYKSRRYTLSLPENFSLLNNTQGTVNAITEILRTSREKDCSSIYIQMEHVKNLDVSATALLLSVVNSLSKKYINIFGSIPIDEKVSDFLSDTGFLDHMTDLQGKHFERKTANPNLMIERGFDKTSNKQVGEAIKKAVKYLTGTESPYQPVYSITQEMCANSIEHANQYKMNKNWLFTVFYEPDKVIFTMTDVGVGILSTLKKKKRQEILDSIKQKTDLDVLYGAFDKKYLSATLDNNRNKGLPKIRETSMNGYVNNLKVLTNNVLLDFANAPNSRSINSKLNGTFYYWELTKESIDIWKKRKQNNF